MTAPLTTWFCDVCDEIIDDPKKGYVIWRTDGAVGEHDFKIIHQKKCDQRDYPASGALEDFLGPDGLARILSHLSVGPLILQATGHSHRRVKDINEFVDFIRRVQTPHYEQARRKFFTEELREDFSDSNELYPYLPQNLKRIAAKY